MALPQPSNYEIYATAFGKVRSGKILDNDDFTFPLATSGSATASFDESGRLAVAIAVDDVKENQDLRSKGDLEATLKELLGK